MIRPEERKTVRLSVALSVYEYETLRRMRKKHGLIISEMLREQIVFAVIRYEASDINKQPEAGDLA